MTPKEKAIELHFKYSDECMDTALGYELAMHAVNDVLDEIEIIHFNVVDGKLIDGKDVIGERYLYWVNVKKELEKVTI